MTASEPDASDPSPDQEWTFHPGDVISERYAITDHLGQGAFGEVHAARDQETDRRVALKILQTDSVERDPKAVARMRQEAEILRALDHPNLVQVYDIGSVGQHEYLVMELLEGRSLDELIADEDLATPDRLRPIAAQILSALDAMHDRDVQHRDIKPDNIVLLERDAPGEIVKLVDFGIAKAQDFLDGEHEFTLVETQEDEFVGTPRYAAPEQAVGDPVGPSADLFSFGLVAAEWLTGTPRIEHSDERGALSVLIKPEPIDVSDCPTDWQPWLVRMIAKKPEERYGSAAEALEELPGLADPGDWIQRPGVETDTEDVVDPTEPLERGPDGGAAAADDHAAGAQIGEPGDPLEPTEVSTGPAPPGESAEDSPASPPRSDDSEEVEMPEERPVSASDRSDADGTPTEPPADGHTPGQRAAVADDQPTEPAGSAPDRHRRPARAERETAEAPRQTDDEELDDSMLFWTVAAAAFFLGSLLLFLYTVLTS